MKKSMTQKEMVRVVDDLIARYGIIEAIRLIELKIKHPGFGVEFCFLCGLYSYTGDGCKGCPYEKMSIATATGCAIILDSFKSSKHYKNRRVKDYTKMLAIAKSKQGDI